MKLDIQKSFQHPVLRPLSDDYVEGEISFEVKLLWDQKTNKVKLQFESLISSSSIKGLIQQRKASYLVTVRCRTTFFSMSFIGFESTIRHEFFDGELFGDVELNLYVVANEVIDSYISEEFNEEYEGEAFTIRKNAILACAEPKNFLIEREAFKPVTSVFNLAEDKNQEIEQGKWVIDLEQDTVYIKLHSKDYEKITIARNLKTNQAVLLNSLYFVAVVEAVDTIYDEERGFDIHEKKWSRVVHTAIEKCETVTKDDSSYVIAQELLKGPLNKLVEHVFDNREY